MACRGRSWQDLRFGLPLPMPDPINQSFYALLLRVNAITGGELTSLTWFVQATSAKLKALEVASTMRDTDEDHFKAVKGSAGGDADGEPSSAALLRLLKGEAHRDQRKEV